MREFTEKENKILKEDARYFLRLQEIHKMDISESEAEELRFEAFAKNRINIMAIQGEE